MRKIIKIIFFCCVISNFFICSCTKEIEIDTPKTAEKIVVYSTIVPFYYSNPKELKVSVRNSAYIFDTSISDIKDALVLYYENGHLKDTLRYNKQEKGYQITKKITDYPKVGNFYSIKVIKNGYKIVSANTYIPKQVKIDTVILKKIAYIDETGSAFSELTLSFEDPVNDTNYYEIVVSDRSYDYYNQEELYSLSSDDDIITSEAYYPSILNIDLKNPKYILFSDKTINGKRINIHLFYCPPQEESSVRYITNHYIDIHFRNVTKDYFLFKTTLLQNRNSMQEDILYGMSAPINTYTNIKNGYGLFSGYNEYIFSLKIDSVIVH
jgi:hypothetical protein